MSNSSLYPPSPSNIPDTLTKAKVSYKRQAVLAMMGLLGFILIYLSLTAGLALIAYKNIMLIQTGQATLAHMLMAGISALLTFFMLKSLFTVRKSGDPGGIEVTADDEPKLFAFLHELADEIGAPKPHRVFITPEVNAAVFYDLSLLNLIFPSRKNLIVGLGLVNVLNLGELKAVLAHEFGHFAQNSMMVGRWVYIAQQIISHMVVTRGWLDKIVRFVSRIDLRIAWIGWIVGLIIWSIRSLMDTLFRLVIIAERALSREMEFNADLVAVSVTGSDALVNALHKLQAADDAWQSSLDVAQREAGNGNLINDLFETQRQCIQTIGKILNDDEYGTVPNTAGTDPSQARIFSEEIGRPPQMWSTHPANRDREDNAKSTYIKADIDQRSAWEIFIDADSLRQKISLNFYQKDKINEMASLEAEQAVANYFDRTSYNPQYRGTYLSRSPIRQFNSVDELLKTANIHNIDPATAIAGLYPASLSEDLEAARNLSQERSTLEGLSSGELKPSGGIIRHRGEELKKGDIPDAIKQIDNEQKIINDRLKVHDANCRVAHLQAAKQLGQDWENYLLSLIKLLHCSEHLSAIVSNEQALLINTWHVITADGQIGYFEKRRMLRVCKQVEEKLWSVSDAANKIVLPQPILEATGIENWQEQYPKFDLANVDKKNWGDWCQAASERIQALIYALDLVRNATLEQLITTEAAVAKHIQQGTTADEAPAAGVSPSEYQILPPGAEHVLQYKLDLWNRFQLAHGIFPSTLRLIVALSIVGGTLYSGFVVL